MRIAAIAVAFLTLGGCLAPAAFSPRVANGFLYAETKAHENITASAVGSKTGEACSTSILGLITTGDASVTTAANNGKITKISNVDNRYKQILGVWAEYCIVVHGD
jgi:hypothetical protein